MGASGRGTFGTSNVDWQVLQRDAQWIQADERLSGGFHGRAAHPSSCLADAIDAVIGLQADQVLRNVVPRGSPEFGTVYRSGLCTDHNCPDLTSSDLHGTPLGVQDSRKVW